MNKHASILGRFSVAPEASYNCFYLLSGLAARPTLGAEERESCQKEVERSCCCFACSKEKVTAEKSGLRLIQDIRKNCVRKQQMELRETVRPNSSFLFAGTAEEARCGLSLLAHFYNRHANTCCLSLFQSPNVMVKYQFSLAASPQRFKTPKLLTWDGTPSWSMLISFCCRPTIAVQSLSLGCGPQPMVFRAHCSACFGLLHVFTHLLQTTPASAHLYNKLK